jgi:hypothetical protein
MPLYKISRESTVLEAIPPKTFEQVELQERKHLQAMLRDNPAVLGEDLLLIAEEFSNWQDSQRRVDLLAIDSDRNLVVIELKRVETGSHMELQALRYAAMLAPMDFETVVQSYKNFLAKTNAASDPLEAEERLRKFLDIPSPEEVPISRTPRILLISPSFSRELTTAVLWLNEMGLDLRCMEARPYSIGSDLFLTLEQIIPLPSAADYVVTLGKKARRSEQQVSTRRSSTTMQILVSHGVLGPGTRLKLIKVPRAGLDISDKRAYGATFLSGNEVCWDYDGQTYTLSRLCKIICQTFGGQIGSGAFPGPDLWAIEGEDLALSERARALIEGADDELA